MQLKVLQKLNVSLVYLLVKMNQKVLFFVFNMLFLDRIVHNPFVVLKGNYGSF